MLDDTSTVSSPNMAADSAVPYFDVYNAWSLSSQTGWLVYC